ELTVMRYRVEQLAAECSVSVDTVRYYQSRGLLPAPEREGRVAWYGPHHVQRIHEIRSLQRKGLTLAAIERVARGELGKADADLAAAVAAARALGDAGELLSLDEFANRSGVPASLLQAIEREGIQLGITAGACCSPSPRSTSSGSVATPRSRQRARNPAVWNGRGPPERSSPARGRGEGPGGSANVRHHRPAIRSGQPRHDVRDGRPLA